MGGLEGNVREIHTAAPAGCGWLSSNIYFLVFIDCLCMYMFEMTEMNLDLTGLVLFLCLYVRRISTTYCWGWTYLI